MPGVSAALGWAHYELGWHAVCVAGAPAAAVSLGLTVHLSAGAMALVVPGAGGVQRAFGSTGKPLEVGLVTDTGVRAAGWRLRAPRLTGLEWTNG